MFIGGHEKIPVVSCNSLSLADFQSNDYLEVTVYKQYSGKILKILLKNFDADRLFAQNVLLERHLVSKPGKFQYAISHGRDKIS
jgi:hypothetical protein